MRPHSSFAGGAFACCIDAAGRCQSLLPTVEPRTVTHPSCLTSGKVVGDRKGMPPPPVTCSLGRSGLLIDPPPTAAFLFVLDYCKSWQETGQGASHQRTPVPVRGSIHGMERVAGQRGDEGRVGGWGLGEIMGGGDSKKQRGVSFCRAGPWAASCSHTCLLDNGTPSVDFRALFGKQDMIGNRP